jgi:beta-glucosidase/6-phospho-beta-glucosidase/beta-galactosidase
LDPDPQQHGMGKSGRILRSFIMTLMVFYLVLQLEGYIPKFGVTAVDRANGNKRYPKKSSAFLKRFFDSAVKA